MSIVKIFYLTKTFIKNYSIIKHNNILPLYIAFNLSKKFPYEVVHFLYHLSIGLVTLNFLPMNIQLIESYQCL